ERRTGELVSRLKNDVELLRATLTGGLLGILPQVVTVVGWLTLAILLNWRLALVAGLAAPPIVGFALIFGRRLRRLANRAQAELGGATAILEETLAGGRSGKAFA